MGGHETDESDAHEIWEFGILTAFAPTLRNFRKTTKKTTLQ